MPDGSHSVNDARDSWRNCHLPDRASAVEVCDISSIYDIAIVDLSNVSLVD